jgi:hypothetical protein
LAHQLLLTHFSIVDAHKLRDRQMLELSVAPPWV